tara:strand:+ start:115 stop:744 length:630 start_codon:yes stop_codon:yes gene_type:complete
LTGILLILGPIGTFVIWGFLEPVIIGNADTASENLKLYLANETAYLTLGIIGGVCFIGWFVGLGMLATLLRNKGGSGSAYSGAAAILFPGLAGVAMASWGLQKQAIEVAKTVGHEAGHTLQLTADNIGGGLGFVWPIATILIGTSIIMRKSEIPVTLGWVLSALAAIGVILFIFGTPSTPGLVGFLVWIAMGLTNAAMGFVLIRSQKSS